MGVRIRVFSITYILLKLEVILPTQSSLLLGCRVRGALGKVCEKGELGGKEGKGLSVISNLS